MNDATADNPTPTPPAPSAKLIIPFNLNSYIYVRLTPAGKAHHAMQHAMFHASTGRTEHGEGGMPYEPPHENSQGYSRWQAWEFMLAFGTQMFQGNPELVCDMNILLDFKPHGT